MDLFVVSRSRWEKSDTLEHLGKCARQATLVVPKKQVHQYQQLADQYRCRVVGCLKDGIAHTRRRCGVLCRSGKFLMLDDDLKFYRRISPSDWHLRYLRDLPNCSATRMLREVESRLDQYAHVAISAREGNNRLPYSGVECSRPLRALAYQKEPFLALEHGRVQIMEDFDVTLQLLREGYKNFVIAAWSQGQSQTQMAGGCSDYRTKELHERNVRKLASLHVPFVRLRNKCNKSGGEFGSRLEATIYWQKAYQSSQ